MSYHKISSDRWLCHSVERTLRCGAVVEIKYGFHYAATCVRVSSSHKEELLIWVVVFRCLCALSVINGRGLQCDIESFWVAGVYNERWVRSSLEE